MNFLAHALLAGDDPALVVGGVAGDWIKGPLPGPLPDDLARGVALHRAIDRHADSDPAFRQSRARISPARRRYAGVLIDIFYDHLLARDWACHHPQPLPAFTAGVYARIAERAEALPAAARPVLARMAEEDWLASYATPAGIADVLARMARRARQPNPLAGGECELFADPAAYAGDFHRWLKAARTFVATTASTATAHGR